MNQQRKTNADQAFTNYDFEPNQVVQDYQWNTDDDKLNEWTKLLQMEDENLNPFKQAFIVRFIPNTNEVTEAYQGDPH